MVFCYLSAVSYQRDPGEHEERPSRCQSLRNAASGNGRQKEGGERTKDEDELAGEERKGREGKEDINIRRRGESSNRTRAGGLFLDAVDKERHGSCCGGECNEGNWWVPWLLTDFFFAH